MYMDTDDTSDIYTPNHKRGRYDKPMSQPVLSKQELNDAFKGLQIYYGVIPNIKQKSNNNNYSLSQRVQPNIGVKYEKKWKYVNPFKMNTKIKDLLEHTCIMEIQNDENNLENITKLWVDSSKMIELACCVYADEVDHLYKQINGFKLNSALVC